MHRSMRSCLLAVALTATAATGCSDRQPLPSVKANPRLATAIDLGALPPDATVDVVIGLPLATAKLQRFLDKLPDSRDVLRPAEFADEFAVTRAQYNRVTSWLESAGLTVTRISDGRSTVSASGPAAAVERAFGTYLHQFQDSDGTFFAAVESVSAPANVPVSGVVGLSGGLPWRSHLVHPNAGLMPYKAAQLETTYNTLNIAGISGGADKPGDGQTVAILGTGTAPTTTDLASYLTASPSYGHNAMVGTYTIEHVGGPNRDPQDLADNEGVENTLDAEMVLALAPYAKIVHVMTATNTPGLFADGIADIVNNHPEAHAVSVSYGTCERGAAGEMPVVNAMLAQAKAEGQLWFFAAGDSGSDGCRAGAQNTVLSAGWPASSPFAIGVGGTQIDAGSGAEIVWNGNPGGGAGGGGVSESFAKPAYQMGHTPNDNSRDEPDVAALSGAPGVYLYAGGPTSVGGTSAATPMWAGIWALLEQSASSAKYPDSIERIYALAESGKGFHDVISGNNGGPGDTATGGYPAATGYDLATGWGTPNLAEMIANWQK